MSTALCRIDGCGKLLYRAGNSTQCSVMTERGGVVVGGREAGREAKREGVY